VTCFEHPTSPHTFQTLLSIDQDMIMIVASAFYIFILFHPASLVAFHFVQSFLSIVFEVCGFTSRDFHALVRLWL